MQKEKRKKHLSTKDRIILWPGNNKMIQFVSINNLYL